MGVNNPNVRPTVKVKAPTVKPEITRPVTPKQRQAINRGVTNAQTQTVLRAAAKVAKPRLKPVDSGNLIDHVLSDVGNVVSGAVKSHTAEAQIQSSAKERKLAKAIVGLPAKELQVHTGMAQLQNNNATERAIGNAILHPGKALKGAISAERNRQQLQEGTGTEFFTGLGKVAAATVKHPGKVLKATVKSLPSAVEGLVAGPVNLARDPVAAGKGIKKDYNTRYGKDAGKAAQKEGLLPYALDVATAAVPLGRGAGMAAEVRGAKVMAERPNLRVSQERVVPQERSPNIIKAVAQSAADRAAAKATLKRQNAGHPRGIEPQNANEVVPKSRRTANKLLRESYGVRSGLNRNLHAQGRQELRDVFEKQIPKALTKDQINHGALRYAVEHGIRTPAHAETFLPKLKALIEENRTHAPIHDELPHIDWLIAHPHVFNEPLGQIADTVRGLGKRLGAEDPRLKPKQQIQRDITPQSILLGHGPRPKGQRIKTYEAKVAEARKEAGLAEPGYFKHVPFLKQKLSDYVRGTAVHGAIKGHKETNYVLMKQGAAVVHPQALQDALARNLKSQFQVNHVADTVAGFGVRKLVDKQTGEAIHIDPAKTNFHDIEQALERSGVTDLVPYRPGTIYKKMQEQADHPGDGTKFLSNAYEMAKDPGEFRNKTGWTLIPREIDKQMRSSLSHNGPISRLLAKNKAFSTNIVLGQNPSWPVFRVIHNLGASAVFSVNPLKGAEGLRKLTAEQTKAVRAWTGSDPFHFDQSPPRMGAAAAPDSKLDMLRQVAMSDTKIGKAIRAANPAAWARTIAKPAMAAERHQMSFFRFAAAFQKLDKDARAKVTKDLTGFYDTAAKARDELIKDPQYMETLAHHVNEIYGDFAHYPGIQRGLSQNIMFYGFLRYATRVVLKTLPQRHPIKANILLNLSRQNERNTREVLGLGPNDPLPFGAASNVYFRDKGGHLHVMGLHRANPFGAASLEGLNDPGKVVTSEFPYGISEALTQAFKVDLLRRHGLRVDGQASEKGLGDHISLVDRARIAAADLGKMGAPYRVWDNTVAGGRKMGNDSLAFSPRPIIHKQTQAIANDLLAEKFGKKGGLLANVLKAEAPFLPAPSRDDQLALQAKQINERLSGKKLTPAQKAAEQRKIVGQPGYIKAYREAQVLSAQRRKHRASSGGSTSSGGNAIDNVIGGSNAIDSILGP